MDYSDSACRPFFKYYKLLKSSPDPEEVLGFMMNGTVYLVYSNFGATKSILDPL